jgi:hypothetical protein
MISQSDDPEAQLVAARHYVNNKVNLNLPALSNGHGYGHQKLRIAYLSSDFSLHPVSMLMVQLFELHDREQFEVFGYCWSPEDGSALRQRVISAMDHYQRIDQMSDAEVARMLREQEIDILVDLQGQTFGARPDILAARPAPVQITYLGLPATTGFPFIDYVIADEFLIPPDYAPYYSEKPLYMPDIYQVSDRKRTIAEVPSRESVGLPEQGLVFCSFNNNYKFTPQMFDVWMNILKRVPGSVLWLLSDNQWAGHDRQRRTLGRPAARDLHGPLVRSAHGRGAVDCGGPQRADYDRFAGVRRQGRGAGASPGGAGAPARVAGANEGKRGFVRYAALCAESGAALQGAGGRARLNPPGPGRGNRAYAARERSISSPRSAMNLA